MHELTFDECRDSLRLCLRPCHQPKAEDESYIKRQMDEKGLFSDYTIQSLLDELDVIEYYQQPGKKHHLSEKCFWQALRSRQFRYY